jgi:hypothetical protein
MSSRKQRREIARWETATRAWATETARSLALDLYRNNVVDVAPYAVGVVLDPGEQPWAQVPARCSADFAMPTPQGQTSNASSKPAPPVSAWLVTNRRVVGRFADETLHGWRWDKMVGCRIDLTPSRELVGIDIDGLAPIMWSGPGVGPLAVAAVYHLHGARALLEHPGLAALHVRKTVGTPSATRRVAAAELPTHPQPRVPF